MQEAPTLLATIAISLALAYAGAVIVRALRLPTLLGYLFAGVAAGPFTPGFVADPRLTAELAEIGVALLLFGVGIHFSLKDLASVWRVAVPGALLQVGLSGSIGFGLGYLLLGWPALGAFVLGLAVAIASTAVATRVLEARGQLRSPAGRIALGWLVMQDLLVILALVLLPSIADPGNGGALEFAENVGRKLLQVGGFVAVVLLAGRKAIPWLLARTARDGSRELFRLAVIVLALGVAYAAAKLGGVSLALGAFFAGVVLAESDLSHQAAAESVPVQQIFTILFFVSVGMLFDPAVLVRAPFPVFVLLIAIVAGTGGMTLAILLVLRLRPRVAFGVAGSVAQIGEFSFILTGLAVNYGILPTEGRDTVIAAAILSMAVNPFVFRAAQAAGARAEGWPWLRHWHRGAAAAHVAAGGQADHVIIIGHGRVGSIVADALREAAVPYVVVEQSLALARQVRQQGTPVVYGDAGWPEVLGAARPETARLLIIAIPERGNVRRIVEAAREANPELPVIVRTHSDSEAEWLRGQAIDQVVMSERETAMQIADRALEALSAEC